MTRKDLHGKFVLPGLADMHAHATDDDDLEMYLAAGVSLRIREVNDVWGMVRGRLRR